MNFLRESKFTKIISLVLLINLFNSIFRPFFLYANSSGPQSPEFTQFVPVNTNDMVNISTGDFFYNLPVIEIPGAEGGGYALSLSYTSGVSVEKEASWVGFGWNLNPGSINRTLKGLPDDYNGQSVDVYNKTKPNWTLSGTQLLGLEAFSFDLPINLNASLRFNNYKGYYPTKGLGLDVKGIGLNFTVDSDGATMGVSINPTKFLSDDIQKAMKDFDNHQGATIDSNNPPNISSSLFPNGSATFTPKFTKYSGFAFNHSTSLQINSMIPVGVEVGAAASLNVQYNDYYIPNSGYGYLNPPSVNEDMDNKLMDYYIEKDDPYNKRDYFIGIPFSSPDYFSVTGEGLNGTFRAFPNKYGHFRANRPGGGKSTMKIGNAGFELMLGVTNIGAGLDVGSGKQATYINDWGEISEFGDEFIFRFIGDLGGTVGNVNPSSLDDLNTLNNDLTSAKLRKQSSIPGRVLVDLRENHLLPEKNFDSDYWGTSNHIMTSTFNDVKSGNNLNKRLDPENIPTETNNDAIVEFAITKTDGSQYVYGQPVFTRNNTNLSVNIIPGDHTVVNNYLAFRKLELLKINKKYQISDNALKEYSNGHHSVIGEIKPEPFANLYLLTEITQSNYVDVDNNGPSDRDFGGWTKFDYRRIHGGEDNDWYRFRSPYNGFYYHQNKISDPRDDVGSLITGEKEVYYLETIETKTHVAFFITNKTQKTEFEAFFGEIGSIPDILQGSQIDRKDGYGAPNLNGSSDPVAQNTKRSASSLGKSTENLERIVLYAKDRMGKPIKVVHFEYDYSLVPNVPNNENSVFDYKNGSASTNPGSGKLTLKRVWFEYEGEVTQKVSPYEFHYNYASSGQYKVDNDVLTFTDQIDASSQNPGYTPYLMSPWGHTMPYGKLRYDKRIPWEYQGPIPATVLNQDQNWRKEIKAYDHIFDPAAWHLKRISLPTGGEIIVQYEQKDYNYVQNKSVMAMASLYSAATDGSKCYINPEDLGCDPNDITYNYDDQLKDLVKKIKIHFGLETDPALSEEEEEDSEAKDKIYYKFLYSLLNNTPFFNSKSEYIEGYANLKDVYSSIDPETGQKSIVIELTEQTAADNGMTSLPRKACYDYAAFNKLGKLESSDGIEPLWEAKFHRRIWEAANNGQGYLPQQGSRNRPDPPKFDLIIPACFMAESDPRIVAYPLISYSHDVFCRKLNPALSYLKLPMLSSKRGGGVRVKNILTYDQGLEDDDAVLFGKSYYYVLEDGKTSSGVSTNEPSLSREENPFVGFMPREKQNWYSKLTSGEDKTQTEGPIGESIIDAPTIIYSRVIVENIHSGETGTGFEVHEYYTSKDYPRDMYYGLPDEENENVETVNDYNDNLYDVSGVGVEHTNLSDQRIVDYLPLPLGLINFETHKFWMAQGFRFIQNSMNGKIKSVSGYGGNYLSEPWLEGSNFKDVHKGYLVTKQEYNYFEPGEKVQMLKWDETNKTFSEEFMVPGKEMDITIAKHKVKDVSFDLSLEIDISVTINWLPPIFVSLMPSISLGDKLIATHATTKTIRYPAILKSVKNYKDGVTSRSDNLAFDINTGNPIITKTYDDFNGLNIEGNEYSSFYYSMNIPASWIYDDMGRKSELSENTNQLNATAASIITYGDPEIAKPTNTWFNNNGNDFNINIQNVKEISLNTYENNWSDSWNDVKIQNMYPDASSKIAELNKVWRPKSSYVYNNETNLNTLNVDGKVYEKGFFDLNTIFDWEDSDDSNIDQNWIRLSTANKYSPNSNVIEEKNALNINSTVVYNKNNNYTLPSIIAQNAEFNEVFFEDFESDDNIQGIYHTGEYSKQLNLSSGSPTEIITEVWPTDHLKSVGGILKFWAKCDDMELLKTSFFTSISGSELIKLDMVAQTGEWALYQSEINPAILSKFSNSQNLSIGLVSTYGGDIFIDDLRFQPLDAQVTCYVYDKSLRLISQFDDQHFTIRYQYNDKGFLIGKILETEKGLKTIQEVQYNIPKVLKD